MQTYVAFVAEKLQRLIQFSQLQRFVVTHWIVEKTNVLNGGKSDNTAMRCCRSELPRLTASGSSLFFLRPFKPKKALLIDSRKPTGTLAVTAAITCSVWSDICCISSTSFWLEKPTGSAALIKCCLYIPSQHSALNATRYHLLPGK